MFFSLALLVGKCISQGDKDSECFVDFYVGSNVCGDYMYIID